MQDRDLSHIFHIFALFTFVSVIVADLTPQCTGSNVWIQNESDLLSVEGLNCTAFANQLGIWTTFKGNFTLPAVESIYELDVPVDFSDPCNVTQISFPDLTTIPSSASFLNIPLLTNLSLPKLHDVGTPFTNAEYPSGEFEFEYTGGVAFTLSLPALENVYGTMRLTGNIEVINLPSIKNITDLLSVNVTSNLDCVSLLQQVANIQTTSFYYLCTSELNHAAKSIGQSVTGAGPCTTNGTCSWDGWNGTNGTSNNTKSGTEGLSAYRADFTILATMFGLGIFATML
ncbi:hypothetical protein B7494_g7331 [Chlorociboria aeruginascens]|nr:hypothetical protein B7494_g7331 [Chlorociboria aeruginascens]